MSRDCPSQSVPDSAEIDRRQIELVQRLAAVRDRIEAAGGTDVSLLPVSKGHVVEAALAAHNLGIDALGENYAQELLAKAQVFVRADRPIGWHFIGQLQTNKVRMIADHVAVWQSVDRAKVAREIAKRSPGARVFAQANLSSEPQKAGCELDNVPELVSLLHELDLQVEGLMGVGSAHSEIATAHGFARLRSTADALGLAQCSMGMTADLEIAIREGSTMVRVGSDIFGPRA